MLELRTLGGLELHRVGDEPAGAIPLQLKRLVLLTYLAAAPARSFRRRDSIVGLFWPDVDEVHARGALRQALHSLRRSLGDGVIETRGEGEVGVTAGSIDWDALGLQASLEGGDAAAALARYRGDFLDGVFVAEASPELEEWIAAERTRLRRLAAAVAWAAAAAPSANGDAGQYIRRAVLLSGDDEEALRRGLVQLDRMGDRAGAVALYDEVALRVGRDLAVELSSETRAVMHAIRARRSPTPVPAPAPEPATTLPLPPAVPTPDATPPDALLAIPSAPRTRRRVVPVGVALLALLVLLLVLRRGSAREPSAAGDLVAIMPFQVAADSSLAPLREGMVELLGARLSDGSGPRLADASAVVSAWSARMRERPSDAPHAVALEVARRVGAGRIVEGSVIGSGQRISLNARLMTTAGEVLGQASVDGVPDSVPQLVDRLAVLLLGSASGVDGSQLPSLASAALPAVRAYLSGRDALRRGRAEDAQLHFREATQLDSSFALAGLELARTAGWVPSPDRTRGARIAERGRERLSPSDRIILDALREDVLSAPELLARWNAAVAADPRRAESWFGLAEIHFHFGPLSGAPDALDRAQEAMRTSVARQSTVDGEPSGRSPAISQAVLHLVELAQLRHDSATVRALATPVLASDSTSDLARSLQWHLAVITSDSARQAYWRHQESPGVAAPLQVRLFMVWTGIGAEELPQVLAAERRRLGAHDPGYARPLLAGVAYNSGRPREVPDASLPPGGAPHDLLRLRIVAALHWDGDTTDGRAAARALARTVRSAPASGPTEVERVLDLCVLGQWQASEGNVVSVQRTVDALGAARPAGLRGLPGKDSAEVVQVVRLCAAVLDALRADALGSPEARARIATADSLARTLPFGVAYGREGGATNLTLARLWERQGEPVRALQAVRRRGSAFLWSAMYMTSFLAEEGRLAALTGDTTGAVRAYRHYLALRFDPEPSVQPKVERVRGALMELEGGATGSRRLGDDARAALPSPGSAVHRALLASEP